MAAHAPRLLHVFSTFAVGGPQRRFLTLAEAFGARYRHVIVAMDGNYDCLAHITPGLEVHYEPVEVTKGATLNNFRLLRHRLRDIRPGALVTYNWGAIEWAMANIPRLAPHMHVEDGFGPEERQRQLPRRVLTRRLVLARSTVVVPSRTLQRIATETWRLDPRRVHYVPNGVDLERFAAIPTAHAGLVIGTVAALRGEKNLARLMRAFRRVLDVLPVQLVIAGDGPERPSLEQLGAELRVTEHVRFIGHLDDPAPLYRELDMFVLSSDTEQMPLSVIEAMASGLPIAATAVGDVAAMVSRANQPFLAALDDAPLAEAIIALARDVGVRAQIGAANRAKAVAEFGADAMVAAWQRLFDDVVA